MEQNLEIYQGKTYSLPIFWEVEPLIYKAITAITKAAPCVVTAASHGVPDGWRVAIVSVSGMTQINAKNTPPRTSDFVKATYIDADTISLNSVNSATYKAYTSGGYVMYRTPKELAGYTARMTIKDAIGGTELLSLTTENDRIVITPSDYSIELALTATETAALDWTDGVYDLELVSSTGEVTGLLYGAVTVIPEVTT